MPRRRLALAVSIGAGSAAGFAADAWLSSGPSVVLGLLVAAVVGGLGAIVGDAAVQQDPAHEPSAPQPGTRRRKRLRVRDVSDPLAVGVHPAEAIGADRVPTFVPRDIDDELHAALRDRGIVLLVGESTAGKTRAAYEAMRAVLPDHFLLRPTAGRPLREVLPAVLRSRRCVVWLDDLERYLGVDGLDTDLLDRMLHRRGDVVVLATMRAQEYARYDRWHELSTDDSKLELWRRGRQVLERARQIWLDRRWSPREVDRARQADDPRLATAAGRASNLGIAEYLAAGPELVTAVRTAWARGARPRAAALVTAAVDARRAGYHEPLPLAVLDALHRPYLDERGGPALRPEPFAEGLDFATTPVYATTSPLIAHDEGAYIAHDYLIDALPRRRIPDETWCTLIDNVAPAQAFDISTAALDARNYRSAERGFRRAVAADLPRARLMLASTLYPATRTLEAVDLLEYALAHDLAELGPDHADVLHARHLHALAVGWHQRDRGISMLTELLDTASQVPGSDARRTFAIRRSIIDFRAKPGASPENLHALRELLDDATGALGTDDPETVELRHSLAYLTGRCGAAKEARDSFATLLPTIQSHLDPDDTQVLAYRHELARWTAECGDYDGAVMMFRQLLEDRLRTAGPNDRATLTARHNIARYTGEGGNPRAAAAAYRKLIDDSTQALGANHRDTLEARREHARWIGEDGDPARARERLEALALEDRQILSDNDADTFETRYQLARLQARTGAVPKAISALEALISDEKRAFGPESVLVLASEHELAVCRAAEGAVAEALDLLTRVLAGRRRLHGDDHPATLLTRYELANLTAQVGDRIGARQALVELQADCERVLSPGAPLRRMVKEAAARGP